MTRHPLILLVVLVLGSGCNRVTETIPQATPPAVPEFNPKSGLLLPEQTRRSLGLRVVDVEERDIRAAFTLSLRVYESNARHARASGRVTPEQAKALRPGNTVVAHPASGDAITGTVVRTDGSLQAVMGIGEVLAEFPQPPSSLAPGQFLVATIPLASPERVTAIPRTALLECSEGQFVYAVNGDYFVRTRVTAGMVGDEFVEITDGLYEGDQVVAEPVMSLWMTELASVKGGQSCCAVSPEEN